jgi:glycosyltransferase involved in cell wall biosynthesis
MTKIGLLMTTYDEEANIERCLDSIKPYLDYYCIGVDMKTTDNTKQKILEVMKDIPGKVFDSPWNGFADARNQCLDQADTTACDFFIYLDADHTLNVEDKKWREKLSTEYDAYTLPVIGGAMTHWLPWILNTQSPYRWYSVLHEYVAFSGTPPENHGGILDTLSITHHYDGGGRAKGEGLYHADTITFLKEFQTEKEEFLLRRYTFYLAQSCKDAGTNADAIRYYKMRTVMGGWEEEIYECWLAIAQLTNDADYYFKAIETVPKRADAYLGVLKLGYTTGNWKIMRKALELYEEVDEWNDVGLFMFPANNWIVDDVAALAYYEMEDMKNALKVTQKLLDNPAVPDTEKERLRKNLPWYA